MKKEVEESKSLQEMIDNSSVKISKNVSTPEGAVLGEKLAKWADDAEPAARLKIPELPPRCGSCAFRKGNHLANTSPYTQMTALKCVIEGHPFHCHDVHRPDMLCMGWAMMMLSLPDGHEFRKAPWDFCTGDFVDDAVEP